MPALDRVICEKRTYRKDLISRQYEYLAEELCGRQVVGVVNLPPSRAVIKSEFSIIGGVPGEGDVVLLRPDELVPNGSRIFLLNSLAETNLIFA